MTEAEWLACATTDPLLFELGDAAHSPKLRLFCCSCVRRVWGQLTGLEKSRRAVEVAETFAAGRATEYELASAADEASRESGTTHKTRNAQRAAELCASAAVDAHGIARTVAWATIYASRKSHKRELSAQATLLRDIFRNPFRPVAVDPAWRTSTVIALAEQMYASRDFGAMPILADALQDAGCDSADVLNHCRDTTQPHVRGCWVVDLLLGKE